MPQTITAVPALAAPIVPDLLERASYDASSDSRNQLHVIIGREDIEATLYPGGLRAGTLVLLFASRAAGFAAFAAHQQAAVFTLTDTDVPEASMSYVTAGPVRLTLDQQGARAWALSVQFAEVQL